MALQLYNDLNLTYPLSNSRASSLESISFVFNPENTFSGNLLQSTSPEEGSITEVIRLNNGSVIFHHGAGVISAGSGALQANQWYQVYATRYDNIVINMKIFT